MAAILFRHQCFNDISETADVHLYLSPGNSTQHEITLITKIHMGVVLDFLTDKPAY